MKTLKIEQVLKDLYESNVYLNHRMVYDYLIHLGIRNSDKIKRINEECFPEWIEYFKDRQNIQVFNDDNWKYFCHFTNGIVNYDCVKVYISLDYNHIKEGAKLIFDFLERNNISHLSKIGSDIRTDDIVIRLNSENDAHILNNYIMSNSYIREGMMDINPFCFSENKIGYAYDGNLSYNSCVSAIVADYINSMRNINKSLNEINVNTFYQFVNSYLQDKDKLASLPLVDDSDNVNDAFLTVGLIKYSLESNNINDFFKYLDYCQKVNKNQIISEKEIRNTEKEDKECLFREYMITMAKKYPLGYDENNPDDSALNFIYEFVNGNIRGVTRTNNLRERISNNLSTDEVKMILYNNSFGNDLFSSLNNYYQMTLLNEIIRCMNIKFSDYGLDNIQTYIQTGKLMYITESIGNARTIARNLNPYVINNLFANLGVSNIYDYVSKYYQDDFDKANNISNR